MLKKLSMREIVYLFIIIIIGFSSCKSTGKVVKPAETTSVHDDSENLSFMAKKFKNGIDFYATGNEPSWSIDIDMEGEIIFSTLNGENLVFQKEEVNWFRTATPGLSASNGITQLSFVSMLAECTDSMSDETFPYQATIEVTKNAGTKEIYIGCANYVPDYRLHGSWRIAQLGELKANETDFYGKIPVFNFNMDELQFGGSSGCNMISGHIAMGAGKLIFEQLVSTMMACPEGKEDILKESLNNARFYTVENDALTLIDEGGIPIIIFIKAD